MSSPVGVKQEGQSEQEFNEQLAKRDIEIAKERAACLKLQRYAPSGSSPLYSMLRHTLGIADLPVWLLVVLMSSQSRDMRTYIDPGLRLCMLFLKKVGTLILAYNAV